MSDDPERMRSIAAPHATVSDKIRALDAAGYPRAEIARFLGKRYQHVRNVLEGDAQSNSGAGSGGYVLGKADLSGLREDARQFEAATDESNWVERHGGGVYWLRPRLDGTLMLPKEVAEALGMSEGRRVFACFKDSRLEIVSADTALADAQALVRKHIPPGRMLSEELIADRRAEAAREEADD